MAFDAGFVAAVVDELNRTVIGARIERVTQPGKDSIILQLHCDRAAVDIRESQRLLFDAGSNNPRIGFTENSFENPKVAPMFCMLLRKHLNGAKILSVKQLGFERAVEIAVESHDELGFPCTKYLISETMGKCSNLMFLGQDYRIISALKLVDFSTSQKRQILPGILYELPPLQTGKVSPIGADREKFLRDYAESSAAPDKFIMSHYLGISPLLAREIAFRAQGGDGNALYEAFSGIYRAVEEKRFTPVLLRDASTGAPVEYSFTEIGQYGDKVRTEVCRHFSNLTDEYFGAKTRMEHIRQRSSDILRLLTNAETRLTKKIALQTHDLEACAEKEEWRIAGDLITANIYRLSHGMSLARLENYYSPDGELKEIPLDSRLTPAQNAQRYYKKYSKAKTAETALTHQLALAREELDYIATVFDALARAENETDLAEIRRELYEAGFASKMKGYKPVKPTAPKPMEFRTSGGFRVLCGKNNAQNDHLTHKLAGKNDIWFHIHGCPGSHAVLFCGTEEPSETDYTEAATIAAVYSKAPRGQKVAVDYTRARNVKKPPASKPGYVTYSTNFSAYVTADEALAQRLKCR